MRKDYDEDFDPDEGRAIARALARRHFSERVAEAGSDTKWILGLIGSAAVWVATLIWQASKYDSRIAGIEAQSVANAQAGELQSRQISWLRQSQLFEEFLRRNPTATRPDFGPYPLK